MSRRARQNKAPKSSLDLKPTTRTWNVNYGITPGQLNLIKKDNRPHTFQQESVQGTIVTSNGAVPQFFAKAWTTGDILQFSSFAAVFDQYKIDKIEAWLVPNGAALAQTYSQATKVYTVIDYDDATVPSSIAALQEYQNVTITGAQEGHFKVFKPHMATAAFGGAFTQFMNVPATWVDCASTGASHYGIKGGVDLTANTGDLRLDLRTRITVSFRNLF
jgi:hypothetical protein